MAAHYYYKPLPKNTIKIEDITPKARNREILYKLKQNDPSFNNKLCICNEFILGHYERNVYVPGEDEDVSWLGNFLGKNSYVKELVVKTSIDDTFYKGLICNKSIRKIRLSIDLSDGQIFHVLDPFKRNQNNNLNEINISNCTFGIEGALQLSVALGNFNNKSLKQITLSNSQIGDGQMNNVITALGSHTNLETLRLQGMNIGRTECAALSTIIRWGTTKLQRLSLHGNSIDDKGVEILVNAFVNLIELDLTNNRSITMKGWKTLSTLFETPSSNLKSLDIYNNNIGDDGVSVLTAALTNNSTLKTLCLMNSGITSKGWSLFSKLLCDTSSINNTYLSNHMLERIVEDVLPADVFSSLLSNCRCNKGQVAMEKIMKHHSHINVYPFFEWELKVLPLLVTWFSKALTIPIVGFDRKVMKFNAIYDFVRELPHMLVGCCNMDRPGKRMSGRRPGLTVCNCSCVIS